jgi:hypothetical protein
MRVLIADDNELAEGHAPEHPQTTKALPIHLTFRNLDEALFQRSLTR